MSKTAKKCEEKVFDIAVGRRPKVLLLGNGPCRAFGGFSWDGLLDAIKDEATYPQKADRYDMPMPLKAAMLAGDDLAKNMRAIIAPENTDAQADIRWESFVNCPPELGGYLRQLLALDFDYILTTNYGYELEATLLKSPCSRKESIEKLQCYTQVRRAQPKFMLNTFNRVKRDGKYYDIWHIHGEARKPDSMIIGHNYYGRLLEHIVNRVNQSEEFRQIVRDFRKGKPVRVGSWVDAFMVGDVYILGLGLGFSETDLWWLIDQKWLWRELGGRTTYFANRVGEEISNPCPLKKDHSCSTAADYVAEDECHRLMMQAKGVRWQELRAQDYRECYRKAYEIMSDSLMPVGAGK